MDKGKYFIVFGLFLFFTVLSTAQTCATMSGDLVFVSSSHSDLSTAIDNVTQTEDSTNYSHMGIVEMENDKTWIIHSDFDRGVVKEKLDDFKRERGTVSFYRIDDITPKQIHSMLMHANELAGQPYDHTYILESEGYYCSEFVYEIYQDTKVFNLNPMTFKNPKTNRFDSTWVEYYGNLGLEIPEGKPGCNPNGMAHNKRLRFICSFD